ncbi:hypothetical protein D3C81_1537150 [compost metagenome]
MLVVESLVQPRQVLADGVVHQVADFVAVDGGEAIQATGEVVHHRFVEDGREGGDDGLLDPRRALGQGEQGGDAAPGEGHQVVDPEMLDQVEEDVSLGLLADEAGVVVMRLGLAGIGRVEQYHVEVRLQVFHCLRERGCRRQGAVDQDDGRLGFRVAVELRVNLVLAVNLDDGGFRPHVVSSWRRWVMRALSTAWLALSLGSRKTPFDDNRMSGGNF